MNYYDTDVFKSLYSNYKAKQHEYNQFKSFQLFIWNRIFLIHDSFENQYDGGGFSAYMHNVLFKEKVYNKGVERNVNLYNEYSIDYITKTVKDLPRLGGDDH